MKENPNGICFDRDTLAGKAANKQEFLRVAVFARAMFVLSSTAESKEPVRACVFRVADHTGKKELAKRTFRNMRRKYSEGSPRWIFVHSTAFLISRHCPEIRPNFFNTTKKCLFLVSPIVSFHVCKFKILKIFSFFM